MSDKRPTVAELEARIDDLDRRVRLAVVIAVSALLIVLATRGEVVKLMAEAGS